MPRQTLAHVCANTSSWLVAPALGGLPQRRRSAIHGPSVPPQRCRHGRLHMACIETQTHGNTWNEQSQLVGEVELESKAGNCASAWTRWPMAWIHDAQRGTDCRCNVVKDNGPEIQARPLLTCCAALLWCHRLPVGITDLPAGSATRGHNGHSNPMTAGWIWLHSIACVWVHRFHCAVGGDTLQGHTTSMYLFTVTQLETYL